MLLYIVCILVLLILAFLCGAIPVALIVGRATRGLDVREHGSGNAGTTNAIRVLGTGPGLVVFAFDVLKGALGCFIIKIGAPIVFVIAQSLALESDINAALSDTAGAVNFDPLSLMDLTQAAHLNDIVLALSIVVVCLGHMFSPFMRFKGGKGVATALGAVSVVLPFTALCSFSVFIIIVLITRYVSLGSIIAVITVPLFTCFFYPTPTFIVFTVILALFVVWAHRKNIVRLSKGEEPKFSFKKKDATQDARQDAGGPKKEKQQKAHKKAAKNKYDTSIDASFDDDSDNDSSEDAS